MDKKEEIVLVVVKVVVVEVVNSAFVNLVNSAFASASLVVQSGLWVNN